MDKETTKQNRAVTRHRNLVAKNSRYKPKRLKLKTAYKRKKYNFSEDFPS